ncbi:MAG TPA: class I SAM-dependent methyltransferase [Fimbriimonadaceae bacterium]|nr:class I SAM-dependent methyltransferase [Fimbriimonadaceae bacterium]
MAPPEGTRIGAVEIDLGAYRGEDRYSDGDVENTLLDFVRRGLTFEEAIAEDDSWPVIYHLSPVRENLLSWYPVSRSASVLEVGAGCGAVTGVLCQNAGSVVAVELSKRRAEILATRHQSCENLRVVVGNLGDVSVQRRYDVVTLIGVLEYAGQYTEGLNPYLEFLRTTRRFLAPGGRLLVAIENRFGLKYWAGAPEDHTSLHFDGIEGYQRGRQARTFSRKTLIDVVRLAGFRVEECYYPMPDYKMPIQIFSDSAPPGRGDIEMHYPEFHQARFHLFDESAALDSIVDAGQFPFFANSFLLECSVEAGQ